MGKLVRFKKPDRLIPAQKSDPGSGRLLMFTGVRYEREPEPSTAKQRRATNKRKRKRG